MKKIIINTLADFTPKGKRRARTVSTLLTGKKCERRIRWYVGARMFRDLALNDENLALSRDWVAP